MRIHALARRNKFLSLLVRQTAYFARFADSLYFASRQKLEFRPVGVLAGFSAVLLGLAMLLVPSPAFASTPTVDLKSAATFSVVAGSYVTLATTSTVSGDAGAVGAITKGNPDAVGGSTHANNDSVAQQAVMDMNAAYTDAAGRLNATAISGTLDGQTFTAGLYHSVAAFALSAGAVVKLDGEDDPNAVFILRTNGAIVTGANGTVELIRGAQASNVFWVTPSYVTFGADTVFGGTLLASGYISFGAASQLNGRALSASYVSLASASINTAAVALAIATPSAGLAATVDSAYSLSVGATGGTGTKTYSIGSGTLPGTLSLSSTTGLISGTPTTAGTYDISVSVTDDIATVTTGSFTIVVDPAAVALAIATPSAGLAATVDSAYSLSVGATGGTGTKTYSIGSGTLPGTLSLSSTTGLISGTPTTAGTYDISVSVTDDIATVTTGSFTIVVDPAAVALAIATPSAGLAATVDSAYSLSVGATGGTGTKTYSIGSGTLPGTLSLSSTTGLISGTPTTAGTYDISVSVTDDIATVTTGSFTIVVDPAAVALAIATPSAGLAATVDSAYSLSVGATGGTGTKTYSIGSGTLPGTLSLSSTTGLISGTPTTAGTYDISVSVTDDIATVTTGSFTIVVDPAAVALAIATPSAGLAATVDSAYSLSVGATGGTGTKTYSIGSGTLPGTLSLSSTTGLISGTPTTAGTYDISVSVTDDIATVTTGSFTIVVDPAAVALAIATPSAGLAATVDSAYSLSVGATGGTGTKTYSIGSGTLPGTLSLSSTTGLISGTPTTAGTYDISVSVTDDIATVTTGSFTIVVDPAAVALAIATPSAGLAATVDSAYSLSVGATGGTGTKTYSIGSGTLPGTLSLSSTTGLISGTPTTAGTYDISVSVTDDIATVTTGSFTIVVDPAAVALAIATPSAGLAATVDSAYSLSVGATGGTGTKTYSIGSGTLPGTLSLSSTTGLISGTPTTAGTYDISVSVTDDIATVTTGSFTIVVDPAAVALAIATPSAGLAATVDSAYSLSVGATGGTGTKTYSIGSGTLPGTLSLSSTTGLISGTPTTAGTYDISVSVTDDIATVTTGSFTIVVDPAASAGSGSAPDTGPLIAGYSEKNLPIGSVVTVFGLRLDLITSVTIDEVTAEISNHSDGSFSITIPVGLEPGLKHLVITASTGVLTFRDAFAVFAGAEDSQEPASSMALKSWTKKLTDSTVKLYAKNIVRAGKIQFMLNGVEIAWVRATSAEDSKLRTGNGFHYLIRKVDLVKGQKTVFEVYLDGKRISRAAYSYK